VDAPAAAAPAGEGPKHAPRVRRIASPAKDDEVWPNERMLLYLDFQIFPKGHPWDIEKANRKVTPAVTLRLDRRGRIERDLLPDEAAERLLRWRIYRQGRLVGRGSATGVARLTADFGPGTYQVWLGVEGPAGFMPVSNLLEYPLFPDASGENVVIPADADGDKIPDFLQKMVAVGSGKPGDGDLDNDGIPDAQESAAGLLHGKASGTSLERELVELWRAWAYDLNSRPPVGEGETAPVKLAPME